MTVCMHWFADVAVLQNVIKYVRTQAFAMTRCVSHVPAGRDDET